MKRRDLVGLVVSMALQPSAAIAQGARAYRVVLVGITPIGLAKHLLNAFEQGLRDTGRVPGRDVIIEVRSANGDARRYLEVVKTVVQSNPDVILTSVNTNTLPVKAATQTIPIVMTIGTDVVAAGLVRSLARPGGNVTGLTWDVGPELVSKRMELLKQLAPAIARVGIYWEVPYGVEYLKPTHEAAAALGLQSVAREYSGDLDRDLSELRRAGAQALYVHHGGELFSRRDELARAAARYAFPAACGSAEVVDAGALMSYGPSLSELYRRAAGYVDKILKGAKPAELPVERPKKVELVVNARTAKALGLSLAPSFRLRVDRIVD